MRRPWKRLVVPAALIAGVSVSACGTQKISVPRKYPNLYHGAVLFSERCAGCHTLYAAGTHGSAPNIRTAQANSGPNLNIRCERPITRVFYAIANGGFEGSEMPQNIVVGQDAIDVAKFVSLYAGAKAPPEVGQLSCDQKPIGHIPPGFGQPASGASSAATKVGSGAAKAEPVSGRRSASKPSS